MIQRFLKALACPDCSAALDWDGARLACLPCGKQAPVVRGLPLFDRFGPEREVSEERLFGPRGAYEAFIADKKRRGLVDAYAAFHPFNESARCLDALIAPLRRRLRPGDVIVDTHNRSGWTGAWLAGLFPEQLVLSFWEGDSVLGYKGFDHWFGGGRGPENLLVAFSPPARPLPLRPGSVSFFHGYDSLHRRPHPDFTRQALRSCVKDGVLAFPHVHLANGKPDPYFDRGGTIRHGREYPGLRVLGEFDVFLNSGNPGFSWASDPETTDYNGFLIAADDAFFADAKREPIAPSHRLLSHPFLAGDGPIAARHPRYFERLRRRRPASFTSREADVIRMAERGLTVAETGAPETVASLVAGEVLRDAPIGPAAHALQRFHVNGASILSTADIR